MALYVVTDIETDGPEPGGNSMLSFASVACREEGAPVAEFAVNLAPLPGAAAEPRCLTWWRSEPEAWAAATRDPVPAAQAMAAYAGWLRGLPERPVFVAHPLSFDGFWIDWYLRRFAGARLVKGPFDGEALFAGPGLDLPSLAMGAFGLSLAEAERKPYPEAWLGGHDHTHAALDDARGYACLLQEVLRRRSPCSLPALRV
ncbi:DNA polymerase III subunit epsilon [Roseomonas sp. E05]|uniref:DNA polymerase III subunit epsilon n=1 Tax=Roseomonas sp. E05 TaxID=3046310 RepID=UPI0024B8B255|nr:DNA polymerase III subunit epsilon [Roseomonas sp. E05]MDJ0386832.1 DNA polymerase III subunit epsilon [Roseomonas sp. E05]